MTSPIDRMILNSVKCTVCGAGYGKCDCWTPCAKCGRSFRKGKTCSNLKCGGKGGPLETIAANF